MEHLIVTCVQLALAKEMEEGPGVVIVEGDQIGFVKREEIAPLEFQEKLVSMIDEDNNNHIFVVHKDNLNLHVSKIVRPPLQQQLQITQ